MTNDKLGEMSKLFKIIQTTNPSTIATSIPNENHIFTSSIIIENDTNEIEISNFIDNLTERAENQILISTPHTNDTQQYTYSFLLNNDGYVFTDKSLIYDILKNEIIPDYPFEKGESIIIKGEDKYVYQITTEINELNTLNNNYMNKYNLSIIDLSECGTLLKTENHTNNNISLIIFKYEKLTNISSQKNIQYEVYDSITKKN